MTRVSRAALHCGTSRCQTRARRRARTSRRTGRHTGRHTNRLLTNDARPLKREPRALDAERSLGT